MLGQQATGTPVLWRMPGHFSGWEVDVRVVVCSLSYFLPSGQKILSVLLRVQRSAACSRVLIGTQSNIVAICFFKFQGKKPASTQSIVDREI